MKEGVFSFLFFFPGELCYRPFAPVPFFVGCDWKRWKRFICCIHSYHPPIPGRFQHRKGRFFVSVEKSKVSFKTTPLLPAQQFIHPFSGNEDRVVAAESKLAAMALCGALVFAKCVWWSSFDDQKWSHNASLLVWKHLRPRIQTRSVYVCFALCFLLKTFSSPFSYLFCFTPTLFPTLVSLFSCHCFHCCQRFYSI